MKTMEYPQGSNWVDIWVGAISGVVCGIIKFLDIYLLADNYFMVLVKVFVTAVVGGAGGVAGKHLIAYGMKKIKEKFKKRTRNDKN